jgi:nucleotide-binding universal stress UspA family protein
VKKILHPTDFSENASNAFEFAIDLTKKLDAVLILLHVSEHPAVIDTSSTLMTMDETEEEKKASDTERLQNYASNFLTDTYSTSGILFDVKLNTSVSAGILEAATETDVSLVVMGAKGESRLREAILGSTTKKIIAEAPCPVLVIPHKATYQQFNRIVYASDFNENDIVVLQRVADFADSFHAEISVLHVFDEDAFIQSDDSGYKQKLSEEVDYPLIYQSDTSDDIEASVANYVEEHKADLLVMFEKENNGIIGRLFHHDMVKELAMHTTIPLMSFNANALQRKREKFIAMAK